jgi:hypothetical protein
MAIASAVAFRVVVVVLKVVVGVLPGSDGGFVPTSGPDGGFVPTSGSREGSVPGFVLPPAPGASVVF